MVLLSTHNMFWMSMKYHNWYHMASTRGFVNNKGADQPAHPQKVISAFVIHFLESIIWAEKRKNLYLGFLKNLIAGVCEQQRRRPACISTKSDQCLCYSLFGKYHMGREAKKPVFGVSQKPRLKPFFWASETIEILLEASLYIMLLSNKRITKALIRLRRCAGWSAPVLFEIPRRKVFLPRGPYLDLLQAKFQSSS